MGLFSRRRDAQGLYTGDAPVSAPGIDGAAPTAYLEPGTDAHATRFDRRPAQAPTRKPDRTASAGLGDQSPGPAPAEFAPPPPISAVGPLAPGAGSSAFGPPAPATAMPPGGVAVLPVPRTKAARRGGCLLALLIVLGIAAPLIVGAVLLVRSWGPATGIVAPAAASGEVGTPVTVEYGGATFEVTVFGASAQPGEAWPDSSAGDRPQRIVDVSLRRVDAGIEPVRVLGWNWSIAERDGSQTSGDIITDFQPSMDGPQLRGGEQARGFVSIHTAVTELDLRLNTGPSGRALATWHVRATTPQVVVGSLGVPVQAQISRPGFTVTVDSPHSIAAGDAAVGEPPKSGSYLLADLTVTANPGVTGSLGLVDAESFVFVPAGAGPLVSEFGAVRDALLLIAVMPGESASALLAFDTTATAGELRMVDHAGRILATWQIAVG